MKIMPKTMAPSTTVMKTAFEVPVDCTSTNGFASNGFAFSMSPFFHRAASTFTAGSYDWSIDYYPKSRHAPYSIDLCLNLETEGGKVTISSSVGLIDPTATLPPVNLVTELPPIELDYDDAMGIRTVTHWVSKFSLAFVHEASSYVQRDKLTFEWTITILDDAEEPPVPTTRHNVPAATDVTFSVGGELFDADKFVLGMRSHVFKTELFGGTMDQIGDDEEEAQSTIVVEDMRPDVFQALLCYIYTDDLPPRPEAAGGHHHQADDEAENDMLCHLLVAADRYDVQGLKLLCEAILSRTLDVGNVAKMLAFAGDHCCSTLKDACVELMADPEILKELVASPGYQQLRLDHPLVLLDVLENCVMFSRV